MICPNAAARIVTQHRVWLGLTNATRLMHETGQSRLMCQWQLQRACEAGLIVRVREGEYKTERPR